jgi:hypothetical protein
MFVGYAPYYPPASSSGRFTAYSGQGPPPLTFPILGLLKTERPVTQLRGGEDGASFLTLVMCSQAPRDTIGVSKQQWSYQTDYNGLQKKQEHCLITIITQNLQVHKYTKTWRGVTDYSSSIHEHIIPIHNADSYGIKENIFAPYLAS